MNRESQSFLQLFIWSLVVLSVTSSGCVRYSFTGTSIPADVNTIYIPFFQDRSNSGIGTLPDELYTKLVNRFVRQSRLSLAGSEQEADAWIRGEIVGYRNQAFTVTGDEQTSLNQVQITVRASFQYANEEKEVWNSTVSGSATYDVLNNPVDGEFEAIEEALEQIANSMFTNSVSQW